MALKLTVESFLQVVRQSGLVDKDQLNKLLQRFTERGLDLSKSQTIADALVVDDIITRWQADKLLAGKHKGFFLGKYRLLDLLGKGGMSSVYLAEHVLMKRRCAIKVLPSKRVNDTSYLARFHREAQAVASVDHPNIVRAYDVDCAQDRDSQIHFLVMEYVAGQSLQEVIIRNGPADYPDAVEYVRQSAEGLEHAHRSGLVHRDIKPGNLLLDNGGVVKILDMGLARFFDDRDENPLTVAHDEKVLGTADYLAPEQALDSHTVDQRADIYSLGCSLYFFLTGHPPFTDGTLAQRLMWHQTKEFPPISESRLDCSPSLVAIVKKMVAKNPDDRYPSCDALAKDCRQWLADNADSQWKLQHSPANRVSGLGSRMTDAPRDLRSDPVPTMETGANIGSRGSSVMSGILDSNSATKISAPRTFPDQQATVPTFSPDILLSSSPVIETAVPIAAPVVATPIAMPVAVPVAAPVLPIAKPVIPIAMPVASLAQPVMPIAAPIAPPVFSAPEPFLFETPASEPATPSFTEEFEQATDPFTAEEPSTTATVNESNTEAEGDSDLFSLFGGSVETEEAPATSPLSQVVADTQVELNLVPTEPDSPVAVEQVEIPAISETPAIPAKKKVVVAWKQPKFLAAGVAVALLAIVGAWSMLGPKGKNGTGKTTKKSGKGQTEGTQGTSRKTDFHEVLIQVGQGGDFDSIGRALYSISEHKVQHEQAAKGKPLRFVVSVAAGHPFEETIVLDDSVPGEVHLKSDSDRKVKLSPSGNDPAITIKGLSGVTVENFFIDLSTSFPAKEKGIAVTGSVARCRIKDCVVSGAGKIAVQLTGAQGGEGADAVIIDNVNFQNAAPDAFGILLDKGDASRNVTIQRCRFISSMAAGVFVEGPVDGLTVRHCAISGAMNGIRIAGGSTIKGLLVENCSFHNLSKGALLFDSMPAAGSNEFCWRSNLFAGLKSSDLLIAQGYDAKTFDPFMSSDKPIENNWSDRPSGTPAAGERDVLGAGGQRITAIEFASMDAKSQVYLTPKGSAPYKTAGVKPK